MYGSAKNGVPALQKCAVEMCSEEGGREGERGGGGLGGDEHAAAKQQGDEGSEGGEGGGGNDEDMKEVDEAEKSVEGEEEGGGSSHPHLSLHAVALPWPPPVPPPPPACRPGGIQGGGLQEKDAMEYLKEVKRRFTNSPKVKTIIYIGNYCLQVYSSFLEIMKEFKSQGNYYLHRKLLFTGVQQFP
jgi:hypothetical protein